MSSPSLTPDDGLDLPQDPLERCRLMLKHTDAALFRATLEGKGRSATDFASARKKLSDQLAALEAEKARAEEAMSEEAARAEVLAFVRGLTPGDPMLGELRTVLMHKAADAKKATGKAK